MRFLIIAILILPSLVQAQINLDIGLGSGYILGSPANGLTFGSNFDYSHNERIKSRIRFDVFISSTREFAQPSNFFGPSIVENTLSTPIEVINGEAEAELYSGWKILSSKLDKENYISTDYNIGWNILSKDKSSLSVFFGPSFCKYDQVKLILRGSGNLDLDLAGNYDVTFYSFAFVSYYDIGFSSSIEYFYNFGKLSIGLEIKANRYMYSDDGYYHGNLKIRANL